ALIARGHRKQLPKPSDPEVQALPASARRIVRAGAAILRVADALDRTHFGVVKHVDVKLNTTRLRLEVDAGGEHPELEMWAAERRIDPLARLLDRPVVVRARPQASAVGRPRLRIAR